MIKNRDTFQYANIGMICSLYETVDPRGLFGHFKNLGVEKKANVTIPQ